MVVAIFNTLQQTFPARSADGIFVPGASAWLQAGAPDGPLFDAPIVVFRSTAESQRDGNSTARENTSCRRAGRI
jgi:hypothetical protein